MWLFLQFALIGDLNNVILFYDFGYGTESFSILQLARDLSLYFGFRLIGEAIFAFRKKRRFNHILNPVRMTIIEDMKDGTAAVAAENRRSKKQPTKFFQTQNLVMQSEFILEQSESQLHSMLEGPESPSSGRIRQRYVNEVRLKESDVLVNRLIPNRAWIHRMIHRLLTVSWAQVQMCLCIFSVIQAVSFAERFPDGNLAVLVTFSVIPIIGVTLHFFATNSYKLLRLMVQRFSLWASILNLLLYGIAFAVVLKDFRAIYPFVVVWGGIAALFWDCSLLKVHRQEDIGKSNLPRLEEAWRYVIVFLLIFATYAILPMLVGIGMVNCQDVLVDFRPDLNATDENSGHVIAFKQFVCDLGFSFAFSMGIRAAFEVVLRRKGYLVTISRPLQ